MGDDGFDCLMPLKRGSGESRGYAGSVPILLSRSVPGPVLYVPILPGSGYNLLFVVIGWHRSIRFGESKV